MRFSASCGPHFSMFVRAALAHVATPIADMILNALMALVLLSAGVAAESLHEAVRRRSALLGVYASDYGHEYGHEAMFAALPLHPPVPIIQILSQAQPYVYAPPPVRQPDFVDSFGELQQSFSKLEPTYSKVEPGLKLEPAPSVLYARPNRYGGYTYSRRPTKKRHAQQRPPRKGEPVIIRVHKYRIIRSR